MTDQRTLERLEAVLDEQCELYAQLDALSEGQGTLIEGDRTDELLSLLAERGGVVERLERSNVEMKALQVELDAGAAVSDEDRERLRGRVAAVRTIAARVAERDAADEMKLAARRDSVSEKMSGANRGRAALSAYGAGAGAHQSPGGARFQDRRA
jgi:hypothetical protein